MPKLKEKDIERFWKHVNKTATCWIWKASKSNRVYGNFSVKDVLFRAHRISYFIKNGEVKREFTIHHKCNNPSCVNPDHLQQISLKENTLLGNSFSAKEARQTHCKRGHKFTKENTYIFPNGWRSCRKCRIMLEKRRIKEGRK